MSLLTGALNQSAVYWSFKSKDGFGALTFNTAVEIKVRWQDVSKLFLDKTGKQTVSQSIIYTDEEIGLDDYLLLGTLTSLTAAQKLDPFLIANAFPVKGKDKSWDLAGSEFVMKVYL